MGNSLTERVVRRFMASQGQQEAMKVLRKVERFLDAYEKAAGKFESAAKKADSPEKGYLSGDALHKPFQDLSKFSAVARNLGQDDLEDLYYDTEGTLKNRARDTYFVLKNKVLEIFSGNRLPNLSTAAKGLKPVPGGESLFSSDSVNKWVGATQKWLGDTRKALKNAEKETKKGSNWT